jgi:hypothetical protein
MGMRQMTFEIPEEVSEEFVRDVPTAEQSAYVTKLLLRNLSRSIFPTLTGEEWEALNEFDHAADDAWLAEVAILYPIEN